ncbi:MAG: ribbon-helix-helix domain-containing protein [Candidatus Omnitrophica bacterium]|nr:ribbon-helix-helix domain-containing protein [Candidatus Omnitrophota bacterium]
MKHDIKPTSVRLDAALHKKLEAVAAHIHRPKTWLIKEAISHYVNELADNAIALEKFTDPNTEYLDWEEIKDDLLNKD